MRFNFFKRKDRGVTIPRGLALLLAFVIAGTYAVQLGWALFVYASSANDAMSGPAPTLGLYLLIEIVPPAAYFLIAYLLQPKPMEQRRRVFLSLLIAYAAATLALVLSAPTVQLLIVAAHMTALSSPISGGIINATLIAVYAGLLWWLRHTKRWK